MCAVRGGALADHALDAATRSLDARDRAFVQELVYGTLRLRGRIDHILQSFSSRPLGRLDPDILDVLRLGAYQLTEMTGVPAYAAISQSVELSRHTSARGAAGFVNGVLQTLRRGAGQWTFPSFESDAGAYLTTWGSHPRWLIERWLERFGAAATRRLVELNNQRPQLYLRLLGSIAATRAQMDRTGIVVQDQAVSSRSVAIDANDVTRALDVAPVIVQDPAAGLVSDFIGETAGLRVLDLAAAPGGKTLALVADQRDRAPAYVVAADISPQRLMRVRQNVARLSRPAPAGLGPLPLGITAADARVAPFKSADVVLLDAPCTGTGTLRRHPDGRWRLRPEDLVSLSTLQRELLDSAAQLVARGGLLVYATCSLESEENEVQVESFLKRYPQFNIESGAVADPDLLHADGTLRALPHLHGYDGAFAARLRRSS